MLRRNRIITAITVAACALPASAAMAQQDQPSVVAADHPSVQGGPQDYRRATGDSASPGPGYLSADGADAAQGRGIYETERTPHTLDRDYGTPDAADAARDLPSAPSVTHAGPGPYTDSERRLVESPEVQDVVRRAISEIRETPTVTTVHVPSGASTGATRASARPECSRCSASPADQR
jgi:hypothetical protein